MTEIPFNRDLKAVYLGALPFEVLVRRHTGYLMALARRYSRACKPVMDESDLVQDLFALVNNKLPEYDVTLNDSIGAWIHSCMHRQLAGQVRKHLRRAKSAQRFLDLQLVEQRVVTLQRPRDRFEEEPPPYDAVAQGYGPDELLDVDARLRYGLSMSSARDQNTVLALCRRESRDVIMKRFYSGCDRPERQLRRAISRATRLMEGFGTQAQQEMIYGTR